MRVLVLGATGLIGSAVVEALLHSGHALVLGVRCPQRARQRWPALPAVLADFMHARRQVDWLPVLHGIDVVVNAIGVFSAPTADLDQVHALAPVMLFDACVTAGVRQVIQVSALGADRDAATVFLRSKSLADDHLLRLPLAVIVLRPSLVFAASGASSQLLLRLALLPVLALPGGGWQLVQPVHIDDVAAAVMALLALPCSGVLAAVGPEPLALRDYLQCLRQQLGAAPARVVAVPAMLARLFARYGGRLTGGLLGQDALRMLDAGSTADAQPFATLLGRLPRPCTQFVQPPATTLARELQRPLWLGMLRISLALLWLASGLLSLGIYPVDASLLLLKQAGVPELLRPAALYGAAGLDIIFGLVLLLAPPGRRCYRLQLACVLAYTAIIALRMPELLLHPFAPVLKNLPVLAALWLLHREERRWTT